MKLERGRSQPAVEVDTLIDKLASSDTKDRVAAVFGLSEVKTDRAKETLLRAADDPNGSVRVMAIGALGLDRHTSAEARAVLLGHFDNDPDPFVRQTCIMRLATLRDPSLADLLAGALDDEDSHVRTAASVGLVLLHDPRGEARLRLWLDDPDSELRLHACRWLVSRKDIRASVAATLEQLMREPFATEYEERRRDSGEPTLEELLNQARRQGGANAK